MIACDSLRQSVLVGFTDIDVSNEKILYVHDRPVFEHGKDNTFTPLASVWANCYECDGHRFLLFMAGNGL